jgi:hypothetical protein
MLTAKVLTQEWREMKTAFCFQILALRISRRRFMQLQLSLGLHLRESERFSQGIVPSVEKMVLERVPLITKINQRTKSLSQKVAAKKRRYRVAATKQVVRTEAPLVVASVKRKLPGEP